MPTRNRTSSVQRRCSPPSICLIGTGGRSALHASLLKKDLRNRVARVAVASRSTERARQFAARHGLDDHFVGYEPAMLSNYDVMVVAVPPSAHQEVVNLSLRA